MRKHATIAVLSSMMFGRNQLYLVEIIAFVTVIRQDYNGSCRAIIFTFPFTAEMPTQKMRHAPTRMCSINIKHERMCAAGM